MSRRVEIWALEARTTCKKALPVSQARPALVAMYVLLTVGGEGGRGVCPTRTWKGSSRNGNLTLFEDLSQYHYTTSKGLDIIINPRVESSFELRFWFFLLTVKD
jgi:hypothetical protein